MKINTKHILKNFKGENLKTDNEDFTVGIGLSEIILSSMTGSKMKTYILAKNLYENETVEVDSADLSLIKKAIEETNLYSALVTGQLLEILEK